MGHIVRYNLEKNSIEYISKENVRLSNFLPFHMSEIIQGLPDDEYIFGVQYYHTNDIQIGITGSCYKKENWKRTITRELCEEIRLYPNFNKIENKKVFMENNKTWFCCSLHVSETISALSQEFKQESNKHERKKKIGIIVHGTFSTLYEILRINYKVYRPNDDISHIVIINIKWLKQYLELINKCCSDYITINYNN
jgi:predicted transcriptional regulator